MAKSGTIRKAMVNAIGFSRQKCDATPASSGHSQVSAAGSIELRGIGQHLRRVRRAEALPDQRLTDADRVLDKASGVVCQRAVLTRQAQALRQKEDVWPRLHPKRPLHDRLYPAANVAEFGRPKAGLPGYGVCPAAHARQLGHARVDALRQEPR